MSRIDQFSSIFNAAARTVFRREEVRLGSAMVVTDLPEYEAHLLGDRVRGILAKSAALDGADWHVVLAGEAGTVGALLELVEQRRPDLVCTYRNLGSGAWKWPYTLGDHVEVLTQVTDVPVLVMPRPDAPFWEAEDRGTRRVMAVTDHLTGDHRLVNTAAGLVAEGGKLLLTHVEDEATFERIMAAIAKLPSIDSDTARADIHAQLLKEPHDYVTSCRAALEGPGLAVEEIVTTGHRLRVFQDLVEEHRVDLLVLNTKDDDQLAMHGLAYPLAVELRSTPLLML